MTQAAPDSPTRRQVRPIYAALSLVIVALGAWAVVGQFTAAPATADYRSRMRSVDVAAAFEAAEPDLSLLPTGREWVAHIETDLLPYWTTAAALGNPLGNFPSFRADDGSVIDPSRPAPELAAIAAGETWLLNRTGRQYTRTMSRQIFGYCVAYHMTGNEEYLRYARLGLDYLFTKMVDRDGVFYSWVENGVPGPENAKQRISQDMAYALMGPAMYYYLTRDPSVLAVITKTKDYIFTHYRDGNALRWINESLVDKEETHLPTQKELVAQLDQVNGYMVLLGTILEGAGRRAWIDDMVMLSNTMKDDYFDEKLNQFWGRIDGAEYKKLGQPHVDFGHTIKTLWMMYEIGLRFEQPALRDLAFARMPRVFREAYSTDYDTWIEKKLEDGSKGTDRIWWLHNELDQTAATLSMSDRSYARYLIPAYRYWFFDFVDPKGKEVWHGLTGPPGQPGKPMYLKAHLWKNAFHVFEHALIGYIASQTVRGEPVRLYYAFASEPAAGLIQPYFFAGTIDGIERPPTPVLGALRKVIVDFKRVTP
jgi:mannose/cellobiose epimerase-like protein (N-acyl-D-glucosamine 2-epimerase family)